MERSLAPISRPSQMGFRRHSALLTSFWKKPTKVRRQQFVFSPVDLFIQPLWLFFLDLIFTCFNINLLRWPFRRRPLLFEPRTPHRACGIFYVRVFAGNVPNLKRALIAADISFFFDGPFSFFFQFASDLFFGTTFFFVERALS